MWYAEATPAACSLQYWESAHEPSMNGRWATVLPIHGTIAWLRYTSLFTPQPSHQPTRRKLSSVLPFGRRTLSITAAWNPVGSVITLDASAAPGRVVNE